MFVHKKMSKNPNIVSDITLPNEQYLHIISNDHLSKKRRTPLENSQNDTSSQTLNNNEKSLFISVVRKQSNIISYENLDTILNELDNQETDRIELASKIEKTTLKQATFKRNRLEFMNCGKDKPISVNSRNHVKKQSSKIIYNNILENLSKQPKETPMDKPLESFHVNPYRVSPQNPNSKPKKLAQSNSSANTFWKNEDSSNFFQKSIFFLNQLKTRKSWRI